MNVSILLLTLNEEANLPHCLDSVNWSDDIVVLDCGSTDGTIDIAKKAGARIFERPFDDWSTHLNWALQTLPFKHPWVFNIDADEVMTPELRSELISLAPQPEPGIVAYRVRYRNIFEGQWLRHCGIYPVWVMRLYRPEKVRWERLVNPVPVVDGAEGRLIAHFDHHSFRRGLEYWFSKHNRYSTQEALEAIKHTKEGVVDWAGLSAVGDPVRRRRSLKELSYRLPFRPMFRFLYMYLFRMGFLDGRPGLIYCRLLSIYEYMIVLKMKEIRRRERGLPV